MAKFGGFVSPLQGVDAARDSERQGARSFSVDSAAYVESHGLGDLLSEMMNALVVSKPDTPVDFLIELLGKPTAPRLCVVAPPGFNIEAVVEAITVKHNVVPVSMPPLIEEARERIIDGKTVAEHGEALPDHIVVKLLTERLAKPDCMEKGWLLEGIPLTKGQAQQLVAAGHVPDKVLLLSAPDDNILKAVPAGEDQTERKKELVGKLQSYRWEIDKVAPIFSHVSKLFESASPYASAELIEQIQGFIRETPTDPGLKDAKRA